MIDINIHLVDNVRDLGPLYTRDCFSFEEKINLVLSFIPGTESVGSQIIAAIAFAQQVSDLLFSFHSHGYDKIQLSWKKLCLKFSAFKHIPSGSFQIWKLSN